MGPGHFRETAKPTNGVILRPELYIVFIGVTATELILGTTAGSRSEGQWRNVEGPAEMSPLCSK